MKRLIQILLIAVLVIGFGMSAFAQTTGSINANTNVQASLSVTGDANLSFGNINQGENEVINADGTAGTGLDGDETTGQFSVSGTSGSVVSLTFSTLPGNLTDSNSNTIAIDYNAHKSDDTQGGANSSNWDPETTTTVTHTLDSTDGTAKVWLGGDITPSASQPGGSYDATVTLEATYN